MSATGASVNAPVRLPTHDTPLRLADAAADYVPPEIRAAMRRAYAALNELGRAEVKKPRERTELPCPAPDKCVYIVGFGNYVKIGHSTKFYCRFVALQNGVPEDLTIYATFANEGVALETDLHRQFADYRTHGEWFRKEGSLAAWIDGGCVR
jgi:hypothetical protein